MRIGNVVLGCAVMAALACSARAEDAVVPDEYDQMQSVGICDAYGVGWVQMPGTGTCVKVGGQARYEQRFYQGAGSTGRFTLDIQTRSD